MNEIVYNNEFYTFTYTISLSLGTLPDINKSISIAHGVSSIKHIIQANVSSSYNNGAIFRVHPCHYSDVWVTQTHINVDAKNGSLASHKNAYAVLYYTCTNR